MKFKKYIGMVGLFVTSTLCASRQHLPVIGVSDEERAVHAKIEKVEATLNTLDKALGIFLENYKPGFTLVKKAVGSRKHPGAYIDHGQVPVIPAGSLHDRAQAMVFLEYVFKLMRTSAQRPKLEAAFEQLKIAAFRPSLLTILVSLTPIDQREIDSLAEMPQELLQHILVDELESDFRKQAAASLLRNDPVQMPELELYPAGLFIRTFAPVTDHEIALKNKITSLRFNRAPREEVARVWAALGAHIRSAVLSHGAGDLDTVISFIEEQKHLLVGDCAKLFVIERLIGLEGLLIPREGQEIPALKHKQKIYMLPRLELFGALAKGGLSIVLSCLPKPKTEKGFQVRELIRELRGAVFNALNTANPLINHVLDHFDARLAHLSPEVRADAYNKAQHLLGRVII